jgi:hypothetical protein
MSDVEVWSRGEVCQVTLCDHAEAGSHLI